MTDDFENQRVEAIAIHLADPKSWASWQKMPEQYRESREYVEEMHRKEARKLIAADPATARLRELEAKLRTLEGDLPKVQHRKKGSIYTHYGLVRIRQDDGSWNDKYLLYRDSEEGDWYARTESDFKNAMAFIEEGA